MRERTKYRMVANVLRTNILQNLLPEGSRLPTEFKLAESYSVSRQTVRQALDLLDREGLITRRQGSGTYVSRNLRQRGNEIKTIGVIFSYITDYIFPSIVAGIEEVLSGAGYSLALSSTHNQTDLERKKLEYYLDHPVPGLIVEGTRTALSNPNLPLYQKLEERGTSIVFIHTYYRELRDPIVVVTDDRAGGARALDYLAARGHRKIGGIFKSDDQQGHDRFAGFLEAAAARGLCISDENVLWYDDDTADDWQTGSSIDRLLHSHTALVCYNDVAAIGAMRAARQLGLRIPEDISLVSFDNSALSEMGPVPLTSLVHPAAALGKAAAGKVINMIKGVPEESLIMSWDIAERQSVIHKFPE